jgi:hypothetical protein
MSLAELKDRILDLRPEDRHDLAVWINHLESDYSDVPDEALNNLAAEIWDEDDRHAPPTHPTR